MHFLVFINPNSGNGKSYFSVWLQCKKIFDKFDITYTIFPTLNVGSAYNTILHMESNTLENINVIVCISGDGTVHEIVNGLCCRGDAVKFSRIPIAIIPTGSGNALFTNMEKFKHIKFDKVLNDECKSPKTNCNKIYNEEILDNNDESEDERKNVVSSCSRILKKDNILVDICQISRRSTNTSLYSFLSQSYGLFAAVDIGTEFLRSLGSARFSFGALYNILWKKIYKCELYYAGSNANERLFPESIELPIPFDWIKYPHNQVLTIVASKMPYLSKTAFMFPNARVNDGLVHLFIVNANISRIEAFEVLNAIESGTGIIESPHVTRIKTKAYRLVPITDSYISIDGENIPCEPLQVTVFNDACCFR